MVRPPSPRTGPPGERLPPGQRVLHSLPTARALERCSTGLCGSSSCAGHNWAGGTGVHDTRRVRRPRRSNTYSLQDRPAPGPGLDGRSRRRPAHRPGQARRGADLGEEVGNLVGAAGALHGLARLGHARQVASRLGWRSDVATAAGSGPKISPSTTKKPAPPPSPRPDHHTKTVCRDGGGSGPWWVSRVESRPGSVRS